VPERHGQNSDDALPKLTIGQRILAALPNLQRDASRQSGDAGRQRANGKAQQAGAKSAVRPDEVIAPGATRTTGSRLRDAMLKPPPAGQKANPFSDLSVAELRDSMKRLDDRERLFPLFVGPLVAALDLVLTTVALHDNPPLHHKGHADPGTILAVGIGSAVIAGLVVVAALMRRRSFTIFALLFSGYGGGLTTMLPAWLIAGWLFIRFNRMQKALVAKTGGPAQARQAAAKAREQRSAERRARRSGKAPEPAGPNASKRYTPPKPVRNRPT
jgi:hypothetical protein